MHALVRAGVAKFKHRAENRRDLDEDDLFQEILAQCRRCFCAYDATKAKLNTWVYRICVNRITDKGRSGARHDARIENYASTRPEAYEAEIIFEPDDVNEIVDGELAGGAGQPTVAEFLAFVYAGCKKGQRAYPRNLHQGRRTFTAAQAVACGLLKARLKYSSRQMAGLFEDRSDLRRIIGFDEVPTYRWFVDAARDPNRVIR